MLSHQWTPNICFPINVYDNIWPNSAPLQDTKLRNLSDPDFNLSKSLKAKCDSVI